MLLSRTCVHPTIERVNSEMTRYVSSGIPNSTRHSHKSDDSPTRRNWPGSACTVIDPHVISPW